MVEADTSLREQLFSRLTEASRAWLDGALAAPIEARSFATSFALAGRKLKGEASPSPASTPGEMEWLVQDAPVEELGRVLLLIDAARRVGVGAADLVGECYRQGDGKEKRAVLRGLSLLPQPERFVDVAVNACRTSVQTVFEAIACENPYPERHFPDASFNQMVLKSLFVGTPLERIRGLAARTTDELRRMAQGYASERRAAGRSVPEDIDRFLT